MSIGNVAPQETPESEEFAPTCKSCGTETYPSQLREFKAGSREFKDSKPIPVHVCPYCGRVTRDK